LRPQPCQTQQWNLQDNKGTDPKKIISAVFFLFGNDEGKTSH